MKAENKILQITPAEGWLVAYHQDGEVFTMPLACFALVEEPDGQRHVTGMNGWEWIDSSEDVGNFFGYFTSEADARTNFEGSHQQTMGRAKAEALAASQAEAEKQ